jgi:hypothetical protein
MSYDEENREIYTSDGVFNLAGNRFSMTAWDLDNYVAMTRDIFETGNANGSGSKVLLCGADFLQGLAKVEAYRKTFDAATTKAVFGVEVKQIVTDFGI